MNTHYTGHAEVKTWQESYTPGACGDLVLSVQTGTTTRLVIADACGHDARAARLARRFRDVALDDLSRPMTRDVFARWNDQLVGATWESHFVGVTVIELEHALGLARIWNAGNPAPLWLHRATGEIEPLGDYGMVLGALPQPMYEPPSPREVCLEAGDVLLSFSDGLTDWVAAGAGSDGPRRLDTLLATSGPWCDPLEDLQASVAAAPGDRGVSDDLTVAQIAWAQQAEEPASGSRLAA